jgi:hypothetical protein
VPRDFSSPKPLSKQFVPFSFFLNLWIYAQLKVQM